MAGTASRRACHMFPAFQSSGTCYYKFGHEAALTQGVGQCCSYDEDEANEGPYDYIFKALNKYSIVLPNINWHLSHTTIERKQTPAPQAILFASIYPP